MLGDLSTVILGTAISFLGITQYPATLGNHWSIESKWTKNTSGYFEFKASSLSISKLCSDNPTGSLVFPSIVHGHQIITINNMSSSIVGNERFNPSFPFYERPVIPCSQVPSDAKISWKAISYSTFFNRLSESPFVSKHPGIHIFFASSANSLAVGALLILSIFSYLIFRRRADYRLTNSISIAAFLWSIYFLNANNSLFGLTYDMLTAHKIADFSLWLGAVFFMQASLIDRWLSPSMFKGLLTTCLFGLALILVGKNGDDVQLGTMVPAPMMLAASIQIWIKVINRHLSESKQESNWARLLSVGSFAMFGVNDLLSITGIINTPLLLPFGSVIGIFGLSLAVNQKIEETYRERDSLLVTLEARVSEKTAHLEKALLDLKKSQAEQVESARLASLGTLSAGIAHEINNSINFVNGAIVPLEKSVLSTFPEGSTEAQRAKRLFAAIRDGTKMTVDIVRSLRSYTGLNQANEKEVSIEESTKTVLTILKNKLARTEVKVEINPDLSIFGSIVGINQIFMNLITNAMDALSPENGKISVRARKDGDSVVIEVADNGSGIPQQIQSRIFDPFFTTKEVGKGTGLGLHIVKKEVERHHGTISLKSDPESGTTFTIRIPKTSQESRRAA